MSKAKLFEGLTNLKNLSDADNAAGKMVLPENSELAGGNYAAARKITNENLQLLKRIQNVPPTLHFYMAAPAPAPALPEQKFKLPEIGEGKN